MDILFWSGGKDAYLALEFYRRTYPESSLKLLTTFDTKTGQVPHQEIPIASIKKQAQALDLELIEVPLPKECSNEQYLSEIEQALDKQQESIKRLVFGDWHLQDIRDWRVRVFENMGFECIFPIWKKSLDELLPILLLKPVEVRISAVADKFKTIIRVGERYDQRFVRQLPDDIDPMGENGEFHTEVVFKELEQPQLK